MAQTALFENTRRAPIHHMMLCSFTNNNYLESLHNLYKFMISNESISAKLAFRNLGEFYCLCRFASLVGLQSNF